MPSVDSGAWRDRIDGYIRDALADESGLELVETVMSGGSSGGRIRVCIYRPEGVSVEDCARVNRRLRRDLEHDLELNGKFALEVSSPGLDRTLTTRRDFERTVGELMRLEIVHEDGTTRTVRGILTEVGEDDLLLDPPPQKAGPGRKAVPGEPFRIPLETVREGTIEIVL